MLKKNLILNFAKMLSKLIIFICISFSMTNLGFSQEISDAEYSKLKKHPIIGLSPKANIKASAGFLKGAMGLYKNSVIPEKYMWLMGLAASAAMKCEYCVHANKFNAVKAGANIEEIKTANQLAAQIAYLSTHFYASQMDLDKFKKMIGSMKIDKDGDITTTSP
tara:strand:+ start:105 stop:596 length:492 start_codon:yes stop_codon:yes gene_type:complete